MPSCRPAERPVALGVENATSTLAHEDKVSECRCILVLRTVCFPGQPLALVSHRLCFHLSSHADSSNAPLRRCLRTTSDALVCLTVGYRLVLQKSRSLPSALRRTLPVSLHKAKQVYNKALEIQAAERWRASKRGQKMRQVDSALPSSRFPKLAAQHLAADPITHRTYPAEPPPAHNQPRKHAAMPVRHGARP